jgi:hypothetical protein
MLALSLSAYGIVPPKTQFQTYQMHWLYVLIEFDFSTKHLETPKLKKKISVLDKHHDLFP